MGGVVVVNFIGSLSQQVLRVVWPPIIESPFVHYGRLVSTRLSIGTLSLNGARTCLIQITWTTKLLTFRDWPTYHDSPIKLQQALGQSAFGTNWRRQWGRYFWKDLCESSRINNNHPKSNLPLKCWPNCGGETQDDEISWWAGNHLKNQISLEEFSPALHISVECLCLRRSGRRSSPI